MSLETFHNLSDAKQNLIINKGIEVFSKSSFAEASTDLVTQEAGISKGLLFHYFESKKNFYLYILEYSLKLLSEKETYNTQKEYKGFYEILFENMDKKIQLGVQYKNEMLFINFASKEMSKQVVIEKNALMEKYMVETQKNSAAVLNEAINTLTLRSDVDRKKLVKGLSMYINTIILQYLQIYKECPEEFYKNSKMIKSEIKDYIDLMLQGVEVKEHD